MVIILGYFFLLFHETYGYSLEAPRSGRKLLKMLLVRNVYPHKGHLPHLLNNTVKHI